MKELKPCPFCGCDTISLGEDGNFYSERTVYFVECQNDDCGCRTPICLKAKHAVKIWNRRVGDES